MVRQILPFVAARRRRSPLGRAVAVPAALCLFALTWATFSEVDVVATATGRLIPSARVKQVQPSEDGVVSRILVDEGERVRAGQPVMTLDATEIEADLRRLEVEMENARMNRTRLVAALEGREEAEPDPTADSAGERALTQRAWLRALVRQHRAEEARVERELEVARTELASARARHRMLHDVLALLEERHDAADRLVRRGVMARVRYLELREQLLRMRQDYEEQARTIARREARIGSVEERRRHLHAEYSEGLRREQAKVEERIAVLEPELMKFRRRREHTVLRAPVDGAVQEMTVFTEGGVVSAGQSIMSVVPSESTLMVEARLLNKDVGFVRPGQPVSVKLAAFPFTRYGDIGGRVEGISEDVLSAGRQPPALALGDDIGTRQALADLQAQMAGNSYLVRVGLDSQVMPLSDGVAPLAAGMIATVDITTGRRRVIDFVLSPLKRYRTESLRER